MTYIEELERALAKVELQRTIYGKELMRLKAHLIRCKEGDRIDLTTDDYLECRGGAWHLVITTREVSDEEK